MRLEESVRLIWNGLLDIVYPPKCLVCGREDTEPFCDICRAGVVPLNPPFCDRCGVPAPAGRIVCPECEKGPEPAFAWTQAVGQYTGSLRTAIHRFKYDGKTALGHPLGLLLASALDTPSPLLAKHVNFDCVVPVPLHPSKLRERGFNQAERIGRVLADQRGLQLDTDGLRRTRNTRTQTTLNASQRHQNIEGAFTAKTPLYFDGQSVLLIDDVLTTTATANECARVLSNAGARRVAILALARGV